MKTLDLISFDDEAINLLENTKKVYPWYKLDPVWQEEIQRVGINKFIKTRGQPARLDILAQHPLFTYLYGNPTSLVQAANCYLQNRKSNKNGKLLEIYNMMKK